MAPALDVSPGLDGPRLQSSIDGLINSSSRHIDLWHDHIRGGFTSFPVVLESGRGHVVTDVDGKQYIDMISQFAVVNFGHSHPKIIEAVVEQTRKLAMINTSYLQPLYAQFAHRITKKFGYDRIAAMVSGSEATDSAVKIARKWGYLKKGIPDGEALVLTTDQCFHGLTLSTMSFSNRMADNFGRHIPNIGPFYPKTGCLIRYGHAEDLEAALKEGGENVAGFMIEPIQGLAGTRAPPDGYLKAVQDICKKYNVLFICDEIQTGYGRTGTDLAYQYELGVQPDIVTLGKAITGGATPMSIVMGKAFVMDLLNFSDVAGTFAANPVACAAALAALDVLEEEQISARAQRLGELMTEIISKAELPHLLEHRGIGRGMFQTLVVDEKPEEGITARHIALLCVERGVLCGSAANRIRLSPPLTISETGLLKALNVIKDAFRDVSAVRVD